MSSQFDQVVRAQALRYAMVPAGVNWDVRHS